MLALDEVFGLAETRRFIRKAGKNCTQKKEKQKTKKQKLKKEKLVIRCKVMGQKNRKFVQWALAQQFKKPIVEWFKKRTETLNQKP